MLSASRQQHHVLHVSAVDCRQIWSMDKSWRCVTLSGEAGINIHDVLHFTTPRGKQMMPPADWIYDPGQGAKKETVWLWRNPDIVTHRQLLSIDQIWRQSTALTWSTWGCRQLADNIWLLAHDNNNNSAYALFDNAAVASRCPVICCWVSRHS